MPDLARLIAQFVDSQQGVKRVLVAFSGGLDSSVLLHAVSRAGLRQAVLALHINHQLSAQADAWQRHCEQFWQDLKVTGKSLRVNVHQQGKGLEDAARQARFAAFAEHVEEGDLLLTAHHAADQVETFFLRLNRGAGAKGLSAMKALRPFAAGHLGRPFLCVSKLAIDAYANKFNVGWVEDDSNRSRRFDRNFLRLDVLPRLAERWPGFEQQVVKSIALLQQEQQLLDSYLEQDFETLGLRAERLGDSVDLAALTCLGPMKQTALIRFTLNKLGYAMPAKKRLAEFPSILEAREDGRPELHFGDCSLRRFRGRLFILPARWHLYCAGLQSGERGLKPDFDYRIVERGALSGGLRCRPHGRLKSQTLKRLLQAFDVEPWLRDSLPVVMCGDEVAAVGALWVEEKYFTEGKPALVLKYQYLVEDYPHAAEGSPHPAEGSPLGSSI